MILTVSAGRVELGPLFESRAIGDLLRALNVVPNVVVQKVFAVLFANTPDSVHAAPVIAAYLEDSMGVAAPAAGTGSLRRVEVALVFHYADVVADEAPVYSGLDQCLHGRALWYYGGRGQVLDGQQPEHQQ